MNMNIFSFDLKGTLNANTVRYYSPTGSGSHRNIHVYKDVFLVVFF